MRILRKKLVFTNSSVVLPLNFAATQLLNGQVSAQILLRAQIHENTRLRSVSYFDPLINARTCLCVCAGIMGINPKSTPN